MQIFTKDGHDDLPCFSPTQAVNLRARGWTEKEEVATQEPPAQKESEVIETEVPDDDSDE